MKKIFFIYLVFFLTVLHSSAQPTQAEIEKKLKEAQAEIDKIKNDPKMKDLMKNMPNFDSLSKNMNKNAVSGISKTTTTKTVANIFPQRNDKLLNELPKKNLTKQELLNFLLALHSSLEKKLAPAKVQAARAIIDKLNNNAEKIALAGSLAWYKNAPAEAALLLTYAASKSPEDNTLNNCGAILNLCGLEDKAIPILRYALADQPASSTLLNNIGQAYAGLGLLDTAVYYLRGCISHSNIHPEACGTVAYIEAQKGNTQKAAEMAELAIKGGYRGTIAEFYKRIKKDGSFLPLLENNMDPSKRYFEMADWTFPPLCRSWEECENVYPKQQAFLKKIDVLCKQFEQTAKKDGAPVFRDTKDILVWSLSQQINNDPLNDVAQALKEAFTDLYIDASSIAYNEWFKKFTKLNNDEGVEALAIAAKYGPLLKGAEKNPELTNQLIVQECKERLAMKDRYLAAKADNCIKYRDERWQEDVKYYNNMVFLGQFTSPNEKTFQAECAADATMVLNKFRIYAGGAGNVCNPAQKPSCGNYDPATENKNGDPVFTNATCPVNLEIHFGVGKMSINCTRYELEMGEGIILNFEKNFNTRESTVAIGVGAAFFVPGIPGTNLSPVEAQSKEQLYITFDKNNQPSDIGMQWETELDIKNLAAPDIKVGYTLGINSGYNFNEGPLKAILNPNPLTIKK
jgi:hypothetical protein